MVVSPLVKNVFELRRVPQVAPAALSVPIQDRKCGNTQIKSISIFMNCVDPSSYMLDVPLSKGATPMANTVIHNS